jgi:anaerobic magnesium-protoporphyrin IX monomethyl ester cyclase
VAVKVLIVSCMLPEFSTPSLGVASLATHLLQKGYSCRIFDDGPYMVDLMDETTDPRETIGSVNKADHSSVYTISNKNRISDFLNLLKDYQPDIVGASATEPTFHNAREYLQRAKAFNPNIVSILGGALAFARPEIGLQTNGVDMVVLGEGELLLEELANRLEAGKDLTGIPGILYSSVDNSNIRFSLGQQVNIDEIAPLRWDLLPIARFNRPISGRVKTTIPIEISRGCVFKCSFCSNPYVSKLVKSSGMESPRHSRFKSIKRIEDNIIYGIEKLNVEYFYFISETFLAMKSSYFYEFIEMYKKYKVPFWMSTRPETVREENIKMLSEVGCERMSIGVECGSEDYRKRMLRRNYSNEMVISAFEIANKYGIKSTANIMIGLPDETREMIFESIELVRKIFPVSLGLCIYNPYKGSELYNYCIEHGYHDPEKILNQSAFTPALSNQPVSQDALVKLLYTFNLYIRAPRDSWHEIDKIHDFDIVSLQWKDAYGALSRKYFTDDSLI